MATEIGEVQTLAGGWWLECSKNKPDQNTSKRNVKHFTNKLERLTEKLS